MRKPHPAPAPPSSNHKTQLFNTMKSIFQIFSQIQQSPSISKTHIFQLTKLFSSSSQIQHFTTSFQQAYLKIFKCFHQKANKKIPTKFQILAEMFFKEILMKQGEKKHKNDKKQQNNQENQQKNKYLLNQFLGLLIEAVYSSIMNVRVMAARIIFVVLKVVINSNNNNNNINTQNNHNPITHLTPITQSQLSKCIYFLLKQKVSTYRQLGIKLSSLSILLPSQLFTPIQSQLFKILSTQQNQHIRKMVITNIIITQSNIQKLLIRLRDKNPQIRATLIRRLVTDKFKLQKMCLNMRYKLLYDGYGTKDIIVKEQTLRYFIEWFKINQKIYPNNTNNINNIMKMEVQQTQQQKQYKEYAKFAKFIELFQPNILLINSHLYLLFNKLISQIMTVLPTGQMCQYIRKLCGKLKSLLKQKQKQKHNNNNNNIMTNNNRQSNQYLHNNNNNNSHPTIPIQLIWLKSSSILKPQLKQLNNTFQQFGPSGLQLSNLLSHYFTQKNIFAINQLLQLFSHMSLPDELGRNKMFDTLKQALLKLQYYNIIVDFKQISQKDDICNIQSIQQIRLKKFMLSYYDIPIISDSFDLITPIISAMKTLRPQTYLREFQQTISQWTDPENLIFKQKLTTILNITKLTQQLQLQHQCNNNKNKNTTKLLKSQSLLKILKQKLYKNNLIIQEQNYKTIISIISLSKIKYDWNIDVYMGIIRDELAKNDKSYGLYMLGFYCLEKQQKVTMFLPIFWENVMKDINKVNDGNNNNNINNNNNNKQLTQSQQITINKHHLLISLKITTDFIIKFNILNSPSLMNNTTTQQSSQYNPDIFMQRITQLILSKDPQIKIFSIQCLCRMIYHNRIDQSNISTYFLYLLLLWWETSIEEVSAKSVHTISLFFRSYLEKGNEQVMKLAEMLCVFHKILKIFQEKNKTINKSLIVYNLKMNQFIKKTVGIAMTVLKYHKQKKTIYTYQQAQLGPQQFFLLYLLYQPGFQNILQRPLNICDFHIKCPLQTLIFVKSKLQNFSSLIQQQSFYPLNYKHEKIVTKKSLQQLFRFQKQLQSYISIKNEQKFNELEINQLQKIFIESISYINQEAKRIAKNIEDQEIFINVDSQDEMIDEEQNDNDDESENYYQKNNSYKNRQDEDQLNLQQQDNLNQLSDNQSNHLSHSKTQSLKQSSQSSQSIQNQSHNRSYTNKTRTIPKTISNKHTRNNKLVIQNTQNISLKANRSTRSNNKNNNNNNNNKVPTRSGNNRSKRQQNILKQSQLQRIDSQKQQSQQQQQKSLQSQQKQIKMRPNKKRVPKLSNYNLNLKEQLDNSNDDIKQAPVRRTRASRL